MTASDHAFAFEIPLEYHAWLTAGQVLALVRDCPLSLPSDPEAKSDAIRYEQAFPTGPARDKNPARAQTAETLVRKLWDRQVRNGLQEQLRGLRHALHAARRAGEDPTLRIYTNGPGTLNAAIALIQACQQELGAGPLTITDRELERKCVQAMKEVQAREQFDLTDEDQRTELVDKAIEDVIVGSPLHDRMVETAFDWGLQQATDTPTAPGEAAGPSL